MNDQPSTPKKIFIILTSLAVVLVFVLIAVTISNNVSKVDLTLYVSPKDAVVTVDGKPSHTGALSLTKGKHTVKTVREHFQTTTDTINTAKLDKTFSFYVVMSPSDDSGRALLNESLEEQMLRERASGNEFSALQQAALDQYPFVADMPYDTPNYTISYTIKSLTKVKFTITVYPLTTDVTSAEYKRQVSEFKASALAYLVKQKVDPAKLDITYEEDASNIGTSAPSASQQELNNRQ